MLCCSDKQRPAIFPQQSQVERDSWGGHFGEISFPLKMCFNRKRIFFPFEEVLGLKKEDKLLNLRVKPKTV